MQAKPDAAPAGYLPRLAPEFYRGTAVVFWTYTVEDRATGWLNDAFHAAFREIALHTAVRENLCCPIYTLMPDHCHLIWMGLCGQSDQRLATSFLRRQLTPLLEPSRWQHQPFDRVLRVEESSRSALAAMVDYIAENPVRARLLDSAKDWRFTGCIVPGYPKLHPLAPGFWEKYWRLYNAAVTRGSLGKLASAD